jgi:hypothetical protein
MNGLLLVSALLGIVVGMFIGYFICASEFRRHDKWRKNVLSHLERDNWEEISIFLTDVKEDENGK